MEERHNYGDDGVDSDDGVGVILVIVSRDDIVVWRKVENDGMCDDDNYGDQDGDDIDDDGDAAAGSSSAHCVRMISRGIGRYVDCFAASSI